MSNKMSKTAVVATDILELHGAYLTEINVIFRQKVQKRKTLEETDATHYN